MPYGTLTHEQARHFRSQGYYRLIDVFSSEETDEIRNFIEDEAHKMRSEGRTLAGPALKMYGLYDRNPDLMKRVTMNKVLVGALESLIGPNIILVKNRHNHATINNHIGEPAEGLHRDILQPTRGLVTAALYLQDSTVENGATRLIPGSHEMPFVGVPQENGGGTWMVDHEEYEGLDDQAVSIAMPKGSVLLFNGLAFHGVGKNSSGESRMSVTLGYRSVDELDASPDSQRQILVHGNYIYRGNDN